MTNPAFLAEIAMRISRWLDEEIEHGGADLDAATEEMLNRLEEHLLAADSIIDEYNNL